MRQFIRTTGLLAALTLSACTTIERSPQPNTVVMQPQPTVVMQPMQQPAATVIVR